jgi:DNA polymerase-1
MKKIPKKLVIIDGHAIIHRAYHALPPMTTKDGTIVHAVYGFASMIFKVLETMKPTHLVVTFDVSKDTFRSELFTEYKAQREASAEDLYTQIPLIKEMLKSANIDIYEKEGYEADDVIGTIATEMVGIVDTTIIVTGDKDLLQLVQPGIEVYLLKKGLSEFLLYTTDKVRADFGFAPIQMIDFKALRGDASDNIPGIKGIGEKTAKQLIDAFHTIDQLYTEVHTDPSCLDTVVTKRMAEKVREGEENARMSYSLAKIETHVPDVSYTLDTSAISTINEEGFRQVLTQYEFFSLLKRVQKNIDTDIDIKTELVQYEVHLQIVGTDISLETVIENIVSVKSLALYLLFRSTDMLTTEVDAVGIMVDGVVYIMNATQFTCIAPELEQKKVVGHDLKQYVAYCQVHHLPYSRTLFDTKIASYLVNSATRAHDVRSVIMRELGVPLKEDSIQGNLFGADPADIAQYAVYVDALGKKYAELLDTHGVKDVFDTIEMPLIPVLASMERHGIAIDSQVLSDLSLRVTNDITQITETIWAMAGTEFNVSSTQQLRDVLFDTLELPTEGIKKGKTGYSTASIELEKLREYHDIIPLIEEYRELEKLRNTYIDVLPTLVHPKTKRIHTSYNQAVAATGRLSSSDPNLQNIPIRTELGKEIRNAFVAAPGYMLVAADYSQIELRIVAHLAKDETLLKTFRDGKDIHTATAAVIHGIPESDVTKEIRRTAKEVNFGVLYGMGAWGLASRTGITRAEAKLFIDTYFERFSGVKQYLDSTIKFAEEHGYVETIYGRRRYIPEITSSNYQLRNSGERMAVNMPIQGTQADIIKLAMIAVSRACTDVYSEDDVRILLQVHDELVLEVREDFVAEVSELLVRQMKEVAVLDVPIIVEAHIGTRWGEL